MARIMRKVRVGAVVRTNQDKTAIVEMIWKQRHRLYRKQMRRVARFYVHDPMNQCRLGDTVRIEETRPISKNKHWRLMEILERKQVAEVRPIDLEADVGPDITQPRIQAAEARVEAATGETTEEDAVEEESPDQADIAEEEPTAEEDSIAEEPEADGEEPVAQEEPAEMDAVALAGEEPAAEEEPADIEEEPETEEPETDDPETDGDTGGAEPDKQEEER